jgi:hypothetical protein
MIDVKALREKALAATPGPWSLGGPNLIDTTCYDNEHLWLLAPSREADDPFPVSIAAIRRGCEEAGGEKENRADADYIAAANPAAITALLERLERAEKLLRMSQIAISRLHGDGQGNVFRCPPPCGICGVAEDNRAYFASSGSTGGEDAGGAG